ncbi:hypothetical protein [Flavihumibacter sp. CACIAM 22H1]|uniref:hypothetical protein n=1 Tax=Flavihumibacter sp. CACIAM 22H1 TaxID=1812911 RepID=UPI0007A81035|nr:hypothetical protein [Flavihumibacter sp. CACIAM 22H1]KYP13866.1 MAG: hypothetical protein A1D16_14715 [Flavihumibacter sp. CACIAM 22H1]
MKSFRTLLIAAIRHVFLVWGIALACITYFSAKPPEVRTGWYFAAACLLLMHTVLHVKRTQLQTRLAAGS